MNDALTLAPTSTPGRFRLPSGETVVTPDGWECLPPGDAGLTRRVKALGPSWTVAEKKGRKTFSHGVWAPAANVAQARAEVAEERADPAYAKRRAADAGRRERAQAEYVEDFRGAVAGFLRFAPAHADAQARLAEAVAGHATPVGSGTVARTKRIPIEERAEAAVVAWLRHQTTAYDSLSIARVKGERRRVRRQLADVSRRLLDAHRH
ncbi:MAG: DUF2293 domain-containing protein, partial [Gemmataceae bacterium]